MILCLILAIVCAMLFGLKMLEPMGISTIAYAVAAVVFLVIYIVGFIEKKREERL